jgi:hypothetical protein
MFYGKHTKTGQIIVSSGNEIDCIDEAVEAVRSSFFIGSINWIVDQTLDFNKFTKEQKLQFLEDNNVIIYQVT